MNDWTFETVAQIPASAQPQHVFFHPALREAWMKTYTPLRRLQSINIKGVCGESVLFMPLVLWRRNWKNAFETLALPVGYSDFDYHNPIEAATPAPIDYAAFWSELTRFLLAEFKCDRVVIDGITDMACGGSKMFERGEICPQLLLSELKNDDDLMAFFKTSLRGDLRRQMRRLSEIGELSLREYNSWEEIPEATFQEFMRQHANRWPNAYKAPHFHENLLKEGLQAGVVHFSVLQAGDVEVAWHLGFSYQGRYYYYMPAGREEYFKYSPTKVHLYFLVRRAIERGYDVFDHLRGEENYKSGWSNAHEYVNTLSANSNKIATAFKQKLLSLRDLALKK